MPIHTAFCSILFALRKSSKTVSTTKPVNVEYFLTVTNLPFQILSSSSMISSMISTLYFFFQSAFRNIKVCVKHLRDE